MTNTNLRPVPKRIIHATIQVLVHDLRGEADIRIAVHFVITDVDTFRSEILTTREDHTAGGRGVITVEEDDVGSDFHVRRNQVLHHHVLSFTLGSVLIVNLILDFVANFNVERFDPTIVRTSLANLLLDSVIRVGEDRLHVDGDVVCVLITTRNVTIELIVTDFRTRVGDNRVGKLFALTGTDAIIPEKRGSFDVVKIELLTILRDELHVVPILARRSIRSFDVASNIVRSAIILAEPHLHSRIFSDCFSTLRVVVVRIKADNIFFTLFDLNRVVEDVFLTRIRASVFTSADEVTFVTADRFTVLDRVENDFVPQNTRVDFLNGVSFPLAS